MPPGEGGRVGGGGGEEGGGGGVERQGQKVLGIGNEEGCMKGGEEEEGKGTREAQIEGIGNRG